LSLIRIFQLIECTSIYQQEAKNGRVHQGKAPSLTRELHLGQILYQYSADLVDSTIQAQPNQLFQFFVLESSLIPSDLVIDITIT